ncbi:MAG: hypothetical protein DMG11_17040 [Acidobacteria bacterium]|nr:MAG: hypothetical protein DMG11_17040 [Acidobacteriota bacterium]
MIPSEAEATLDIRALPGEDIDEFYGEMKRVIGDPAIKIVPIPSTRPEAPASRLDTEMYRVIEQVSKRMYAGSVVLPAMSNDCSNRRCIDLSSSPGTSSVKLSSKNENLTDDVDLDSGNGQFPAAHPSEAHERIKRKCCKLIA